MSEFIEGCSCLTQEDNDLPHWLDCRIYDDRTVDLIPDKTDLRWLAEKAAAKDIDTALYCLRSTRYKLTRLTEQNTAMKADLKNVLDHRKRGLPKPKARVR